MAVPITNLASLDILSSMAESLGYRMQSGLKQWSECDAREKAAKKNGKRGNGKREEEIRYWLVWERRQRERMSGLRRKGKEKKEEGSKKER